LKYTIEKGMSSIKKLKPQLGEFNAAYKKVLSLRWLAAKTQSGSALTIPHGLLQSNIRLMTLENGASRPSWEF